MQFPGTLIGQENYWLLVTTVIWCGHFQALVQLISSGLISGEILCVLICISLILIQETIVVTIAGSCFHYNVILRCKWWWSNSAICGLSTKYWLSNTSMYFVIPRNNSTSDNLTVATDVGYNNARFL